MADETERHESMDQNEDKSSCENTSNDKIETELPVMDTKLSNEQEKLQNDDKQLVENGRCSPAPRSLRPDSPPLRTGFLRSFVEKKQTIHNLELREPQDTLGTKSETSEVSEATQGGINLEHSLCKWHECKTFIGSPTDLSEHVHQAHVEPMVIQYVFVCLWKGCKVFNKPSCSHSWLSKHMNSHTGDKPFKCVISGCVMSFSSCEGLSRHVSSHFNEPKQPKRQRGEQKDSPKKTCKKNKVKAVQRRQKPPLEVKDDFVDPKTVNSIKKRLPKMMPESCYKVGIDGAKITFHSKVLGKRTNEKSGQVDVLLHWLPDDVLPDEWVPFNEVEKNKSRTVPISTLPNDVTAELDPAFYRRLSHRKNHRK